MLGQALEPSAMSCHQILREGVPMAEGTAAFGRHAGSRTGAEHHHLQCWHKRMCEGVSMAAVTEAYGSNSEMTYVNDNYKHVVGSLD